MPPQTRFGSYLSPRKQIMDRVEQHAAVDSFSSDLIPVSTFTISSPEQAAIED